MIAGIPIDDFTGRRACISRLQEVKETEKLPKVPVFAAEPIPTADKILFDAARINSYVNKHKHSATCWKGGCTTCRPTEKCQ